jgi:hypothetical protein
VFILIKNIQEKKADRFHLDLLFLSVNY